MYYVWAPTWQNQQNGIWAQPSLGLAGASTQSGQSSLCAQWVTKDPRFLHADGEDWSDWVDAWADLLLLGILLVLSCGGSYICIGQPPMIFFSHVMNGYRIKKSPICMLFGKRGSVNLNQLWHDKTNTVAVRPAKTQIILGIRPVWSESSLSAWRKLGSLATHWAHSEDSDQTGRMPMLK